MQDHILSLLQEDAALIKRKQKKNIRHVFAAWREETAEKMHARECLAGAVARVCNPSEDLAATFGAWRATTARNAKLAAAASTVEERVRTSTVGSVFQVFATSCSSESSSRSVNLKAGRISLFSCCSHMTWLGGSWEADP